MVTDYNTCFNNNNNNNNYSSAFLLSVFVDFI
jgi:hypothetical protein